MAKNGIESMDCKLFEVNHNDISCENFDIVASTEICDGSMVRIFSTSLDYRYLQPYSDWQSVRSGMKLTRYARFEELDDIWPVLQARDINLEILGWAFPNSKVAFYDQELDLYNGHVMSWAGRDRLGGVRTGFEGIILRICRYFIDKAGLTLNRLSPDCASDVQFHLFCAE